jgi:hypothetical protein
MLREEVEDLVLFYSVYIKMQKMPLVSSDYALYYCDKQEKANLTLLHQH